MYNSKCPNCNEYFEHSRPNQIYCCHDCRDVMAIKREQNRKKEARLKHVSESKIDPKRIYCEIDGKIYIKAFKKEACEECICGYKSELNLNDLGVKYSISILQKEYERLYKLDTDNIERNDINKVSIALKWLDNLKYPTKD
jgi:hypothetical protein